MIETISNIRIPAREKIVTIGGIAQKRTVIGQSSNCKWEKIGDICECDFCQSFGTPVFYLVKTPYGDQLQPI